MTSHDMHPNVISPDGRIYQTEYAVKSVSLAPTGMALRTATSTIFIAETQRTSPLQILPQSI